MKFTFAPKTQQQLQQGIGENKTAIALEKSKCLSVMSQLQ
jgi:hypothetical protein